MVDFKGLFNRLLSGLSGSDNSGCVGIEMNAQGLTLSHCSIDSKERVNHCEVLLNLDGQSASEQLKQRIHDLKLEGSETNVVLPASSYNLLLVEAPKVPEAELAEAIRWKVKDMMPYPLDETLTEVFHLPANSSKGRAMVYVVAAREVDVRDMMALVESADLKLNSIDIQELALRNIVESQVDTSRGVGVVHMEQGRGTLVLIQNGDMYLSRQFDVPYNAGLFDELPDDQLILELQRSLDYYERQMGQVPPKSIVLCGENISADKITPTLQEAFSAEVSVLSLSGVVAGTEPLEESLLQLCVSSIGGALRKPAVMS